MRQLLYLSILLQCCWGSQAYAQSTTCQAWIEDDQLTVKFDQPVTIANTEGFRLVGGPTRIKTLDAGNGTAQLTFSLTDFALPHNEFKLLYWPALGNVRTNSREAIGPLDVPVVNRVSQYQGQGTLYYVSTSGNDAYYGTDSTRALRTVNQAQQLAKAGDYILLRRGDTFTRTFIDVKKSGQPDRYLTFGAYGKGAKPIIEHDWEDIITIADQHYILIDNLHLKVRGDGEKGVYIMGNCDYPIISNCRVEGFGKPHFGINYGKKDGDAAKVVHPMVLNNHVTGFLWNISSNGYPYDGTHEVIGGLIENNISGKTRAVENGDGIGAQRGEFHGLIIRKNEIYGYYDDGIDLYAATNVVVEYNTIHSPQQPSSSGQGIKAGGLTRTEPITGHQSANVVIRHNTVYDLYNKADDLGSHNGIQTNDGASGEVYGNLVYNVQGSGIVVSGPVDQWNVHHNVVVNAREVGLNVWTEGRNDHKVAIHSNILEGGQCDLKVNTRTTKATITGQDNVLIHSKPVGKYQGNGDQQVDISALFINPKKHNFRLKPSYYQHYGTGFHEKQK